MSITRRELLASGAAVMALPMIGGRVLAQTPGTTPLPILPTLDATAANALSLVATEGETEFLPGAMSATKGFNGSYLGPVLRIRTGVATEATVENRTSETISVHWHGLLVPGEVDGGPHNPIAPGETWRPVLPVDQPPATLWYHTHIHGQTGPGVYAGLAGILIIEDGGDAERGLPTSSDVDDLVLVLQDKRFDEAGRAVYELTDADVMHGFLGTHVLVNGAVSPTASVPPGIVRLRLVNGSNGRNYDLSMEDGRQLHLIATDQGFVPSPVALSRLLLSPGERAEVLVDFSDGGSRLVSQPHAETAGAGGMGHTMGPPLEDSFTSPYPVLAFTVDPALPVAVTALPTTLAEPEAPLGDSATERSIVLNDSMMMPGMAMPGMSAPMAGMDHAMHGGAAAPAGAAMPEAVFGINDRPFDMARIEFDVALGSVERWIVSGEEMGHPFHIHGARFQVVGSEGRERRPEQAGWKDTVLVEGRMELLVQFHDAATQEKPFMLHCHVLEHEDRGMMAQFAVSEALAQAASYAFELAGPPERVGRMVRFGVRLLADGQPVADAEIEVLEFNMSPEGMSHTSRVVPLAREPGGVQTFEVQPEMAGRWQVVLVARVPGAAPIRDSLVLDVPQ